jgi:GT2 family glycosyltransferase
MDISIIIVSWNTHDILRDCLKSVYDQVKGITFEVIVIDNASSDDSAEMVKTAFPGVILIENAANRGFAAANNQGMKIAKGRYVLLLNSDTIVLDNAIQETVTFADNHPEAAVAGCKVLNLNKSLQPTCFMFPSLLNLFLSSTYLYKLFPRSRFFGRERMTWWDRDDIREVEVVTGCFMLVRKQAIDQIGLMDEGFFMYAEETDWCYRFKKAGWKILFTPDPRIIHLGGASSKKVRPEMMLQLRKSILLFLRKHRSYIVYLLSKLLIVFWFLIRIPYWRMKSLMSKENSQEARLTAETYWRGVKTFFLAI